MITPTISNPKLYICCCFYQNGYGVCQTNALDMMSVSFYDVFSGKYYKVMKLNIQFRRVDNIGDTHGMRYAIISVMLKWILPFQWKNRLIYLVSYLKTISLEISYLILLIDTDHNLQNITKNDEWLMKEGLWIRLTDVPCDERK